MLWLPFSQLSVFSKLMLVVLRGAGLAVAVAPVRPWPTVPRPMFQKPWFSNMSRVTLVKNSFGDHCQPLFASLTRLGDSVDRIVIDPVVRYEFWVAKFAKPGHCGSTLFSRSGLLLNRCQ